MEQMLSGQLMDISGKPMVMLGGEWTYARRRSKGIIVEYTWQKGEPVMILYKDAKHTRVGAYIIELDDAHNYANSDGNMSVSLMAHAMEAAAAMGFDAHDRYAVRSIMDVILDNLEELITMPPAPAAMEAQEKRQAGTVGELTFKADGRTMFEGAL